MSQWRAALRYLQAPEPLPPDSLVCDLVAVALSIMVLVAVWWMATSGQP